MSNRGGGPKGRGRGGKVAQTSNKRPSNMSNNQDDFAANLLNPFGYPMMPTVPNHGLPPLNGKPGPQPPTNGHFQQDPMQNFQLRYQFLPPQQQQTAMFAQQLGLQQLRQQQQQHLQQQLPINFAPAPNQHRNQQPPPVSPINRLYSPMTPITPGLVQPNVLQTINPVTTQADQQKQYIESMVQMMNNPLYLQLLNSQMNFQNLLNQQNATAEPARPLPEPLVVPLQEMPVGSPVNTNNIPTPPMIATSQGSLTRVPSVQTLPMLQLSDGPTVANGEIHVMNSGNAFQFPTTSNGSSPPKKAKMDEGTKLNGNRDSKDTREANKQKTPVKGDVASSHDVDIPFINNIKPPMGLVFLEQLSFIESVNTIAKVGKALGLTDYEIYIDVEQYKQLIDLSIQQNILVSFSNTDVKHLRHAIIIDLKKEILHGTVPILHNDLIETYKQKCGNFKCLRDVNSLPSIIRRNLDMAAEIIPPESVPPMKVISQQEIANQFLLGNPSSVDSDRPKRYTQNMKKELHAQFHTLTREAIVKGCFDSSSSSEATSPHKITLRGLFEARAAKKKQMAEQKEEADKLMIKVLEEQKSKKLLRERITARNGDSVKSSNLCSIVEEPIRLDSISQMPDLQPFNSLTQLLRPIDPVEERVTPISTLSPPILPAPVALKPVVSTPAYSALHLLAETSVVNFTTNVPPHNSIPEGN